MHRTFVPPILTRRHLLFSVALAASGCVPIKSTPNRSYVAFRALIEEQSKNNFERQVNDLIKLGTNDIYVVMETRGGDPVAGVHMYNFLRDIQSKNDIAVTMHNAKEIDSMGNYVFLAANKRIATANATFGFHAAGIEVEELSKIMTRLSLPDLQNITNTMTYNTKQLENLLNQRTLLSSSQIHTYTHSKEIQPVTATQAIQYGIISEIAPIPCEDYVEITDSGISLSRPPDCNMRPSGLIPSS